VVVEGDEDWAVPMLRQRRRLAELLASFDEEQWQSQSRCDAWDVRGVVSHLTTATGFWAFSVSMGRAGDPTQALQGFDPVATPAQMVAADAASSAEVLAAFVDSNRAFADSLASLDAAGWHTTVEAPPGHVSIRSLVLHALWDSWIHERDVLLPLGIAQELEDDEITGALLYAAALGPGFLAMSGSDRTGAFAVQAADPDVHLVVELGTTAVVRQHVPAPSDAVQLHGPAVQMVEALSFRGPFPEPLPPEHHWMFGGLAEVFDTTLEAEAARHP
jgi:uncharacterized protein (TIGR03083 family)